VILTSSFSTPYGEDCGLARVVRYHSVDGLVRWYGKGDCQLVPTTPGPSFRPRRGARRRPGGLVSGAIGPLECGARMRVGRL
jgi:hypothetical protein